MRRRTAAAAAVLAAAALWAAPARGADEPAALERRVADLERRNEELSKRLAAVEAGDAGRSKDGEAGSEAEARPDDGTLGLGLGARYGPVRVSLQVFGDVGFGYRNPPPAGASHASFGDGTADFFVAGQIGERGQILTEIVTEFESDTNEVALDVERIWGAWTFNDALYLKLGREHSPISRWNRRFHHGRYFWLAATQPVLTRFEDGGGLLPMHQIGLEAGGKLSLGFGALDYAGVVSNGRGREPGEVTNLTDGNDSKAFDAAVSLSPRLVDGLVFGGDFHADEIPSDPGDPARAHDVRELVETAFVELRRGPLDILGEVAFIAHKDRTSDRTFHHRSGYIQAGWRLGDFTPYTRFDVTDAARGDPFFAAAGSDLDRLEQILGVRYDPIENMALKLEGGLGREERRDGGGAISRGSFGMISAQLSWVF